MNSLSFFYNLPDDLIEDILWRYLHLHDIGKLDSATSNSRDRRSLTTLLAIPEIIIKNVGEMSYGHLSYIAQHKLKLDQLVIRRDPDWPKHEGDLRGLPLESALTHLQTIDVQAQSGLSLSELRALLVQYPCGKGPSSPTSSMRKVRVQNFKKLQDDVLLPLAHCSAGLEVLDISGCWLVTDLLLERVVHMAATTLAFVDISCCFSITQKALIDLVERCCNIRAFCATNCADMNDFIVECLVSRNGHLSALTLAGCLQLTDQTMHYIALHASSLLALDVSQVKALTDRGVESLARMPRKQLQSLNVVDCPLVTAAGLAKLTLALPLLRVTKSSFLSL